MKFNKTIFGIFVVALILLIAAAWFFGQRAAAVEMADYVPAETLVYFEINDLPAAFQALTTTDAWRGLAPVYKVESNFADSWLNRAAANSGLSSSANIAFERSQTAVALLGATARGDNDDAALQIKLRYVVVVETKSTRAPAFVIAQTENFARRQFGELQIENRKKDQIEWTIFQSSLEDKTIFAARFGSAVFIGNDERAVQSCLDAKNNVRAPLADDEKLQEMRANVESKTAFAFGFVTSEGVKQLSEIAAVFAAGNFAEDSGAANLLAQSLPQFLQKSIVAVGWTARANEGNIEDRYLIEMPANLTERLREPLAANQADNSKLVRLLPSDAQSIAVYNFKNAANAWRGSLLALTTKLDAATAIAISTVANRLLEPYGVAKADQFLAAADNQFVTARLSSIESNKTVAVAAVKNAEQIKATLRQDEDFSSQFDNQFLLLGDKENLARCSAARNAGQTFDAQPIWLKFNRAESIAPNVFTRTLTRDDVAPLRFVQLFSREKPTSMLENSPVWAWTIGETRMVRVGLERRIISPFGLIGTLTANFVEK